MRPDRIVVYEGIPAAEDSRVEMCEHKGVGHPDTVMDATCEAVALTLVEAYEARFGRCLHFNVDKGLLVGGRSAPRFGGGEVIERPKIIVCGRASDPDRDMDIARLVSVAARGWLDANLAAGSSLFDISSEVKEGSANLREVLAPGATRANDTSFGVGYAPLSALERKVLELATALRSRALREAVPPAGDDFKVMGLRSRSRFTFTIAVAMKDRDLRTVGDYYAATAAVRAHLREFVDRKDDVWVNRLDDPAARDERGIYLTVTGLSAEMGDDGQVGRGNRVNGLITPCRAMSLEAAAGKNPFAHVGKIYNVLAHRIAADICREVPEVRTATVRLLSAIGNRVDDPASAAIEIAGDSSAAVKARVRKLVNARFADLAPFLADLAHGRVPVAS